MYNLTLRASNGSADYQCQTRDEADHVIGVINGRLDDLRRANKHIAIYVTDPANVTHILLRE